MGSYYEVSAKVSPRLSSMDGLAAYLGLTLEQFGQKHADFQKRGMPQPVMALGMYDLKAIDIWLDRVSGIASDGRSNFHPTEPHSIDFKADAQLSAGPTDDPRDAYTVVQCLDDYLVWFRTYKKNIRDTQNRVNATIMPAFGQLKVIDLTVKQLREWHAAIAASPKSIHVGYGKKRQYADPPRTPEEIRKRRNTANHDLCIFKAALNKAFKEGKVRSDVGWRLATQFPIGEVSKLECLSAEQCQRLMFFLPVDFQDLVRAVLFTGGRFQEISTVTAADYNAKEGTLYFAPSKTLRSRHVVLAPEGKEFFDAATVSLHPTDLIFRRLDGQQWTNKDCSHRLQAACRLAGFKYCTFHTLRHTYASTLVMNDVPLVAVARNLGHANTRTCQKFYLHLSQSYLATSIREKTPKLNLHGQLDQEMLDAHNPQDRRMAFQSNQQVAKMKVKGWTRKKLLERTKKLGIVGRHTMHREILEMIVMKDIDDRWPELQRGHGV